MEQKNFLVISSVGILIFLIALFSEQIGICPKLDFSYCAYYSNQIAEILIPILPTLIFSLIFFWMRKEIFLKWFNFARWWIPLSMLLILITPEYGGFIDPITKGTIALGTTLLFIVISLILIGVSYWKVRSART